MNDSALGLDPADWLAWTSNGLYISYAALAIGAVVAVVVFSCVMTRVARAKNTFSEIDKLAK